MLRLGFHLSISGGVANAPAAAEREGYGAFQIFASNPRSWKHSPIDEEEAERFKEIIKSRGIVPFAHVPYLCNPSSSDSLINKKSTGMLIANIESCNKLGINGVVVHIGSHTGSGENTGVKTAANTIRNALENTEGASLLLENSSGYRNSVGSKFGQIAEILDKIDSDRAKVCLDTCHAFAAGYDLSSAAGVGEACDHFESSIGFGRLGVVHLNDAKYPLGSGLDRHWHIGKGYIGAAGFKALFKQKQFREMSFIMETPVNKEGDADTNMREARRIAISAVGEKNVY
jgi:deoxyribonuclease-4